MFRSVLLTGLFLATPALALDPSASMSASERAAFRAEVRAYLLENPEVLMEAIQVLESRRQDQLASADAQLLAENHDAIFADGQSWIGGNPEGDITIVEFLDYRCGYCKQAHPEVNQLLRDDGNIRYIVKEFPVLGPQSELAARFAVSVKRIAGDTAYGAVHEALMTFRGEISEASLRALADRMSLDTKAVMAGIAAPETEAVIAANMALAQRLQINGTPGFIFETELVRGYMPLDTMVALVAELRN
jgi:protein-disulfide isomerase